MGYTTTFEGKVKISPPLNKEEIKFLKFFCGVAHIKRKHSEAYYFLQKRNFLTEMISKIYIQFWSFWGYELESGAQKEIIDDGSPPDGQPSKWCQFMPTDDGHYIVWDGLEKFYYSLEWMQYLIDHFIGDDPKAKSELPFLQSHVLNGEMKAFGEDEEDRWILKVKNNKAYGVIVPVEEDV